MDSNGMEWPIIGFRHVGGSSWDSKKKEEPVSIEGSNKMEEEEDANKATNHEVFFNDKFPIARRAAATEFLIKAHKFVRCDRRSWISSWLQGRNWW